MAPSKTPDMSAQVTDNARTQTPLIQLERVTKCFDENARTLSNMDLAVYPGEFLSIVGPSGCGKSTILRLMAGLEKADAGHVRIDTPVAHPQRDIAFVFQEATLMPWASVFDNVWLPLRLKGISRTEAQSAIEDALAAVGLNDFANAYPAQLSGGMKMRVSIARASVTKPRILLMDEPFAALDEISRARLTDDLLAHWQRTGISIVMVTHTVAEAVYLSQRILVMSPRPARIVQDLSITFDHPREASLRLSEPFVAKVAQVSRMLLDATLDQDKSNLCA
jgi:NitT/TauT family transport system ATP-binding protein